LAQIYGIIPAADVSPEEVSEILSLTSRSIDRYILVENTAGSETSTAMARFMKRRPDIRRLRIPFVVGKAAAVRYGIYTCLLDRECRQVVQIDGHLKQSPIYVENLLELTDSNRMSMAVYNRYPEGRQLDQHRSLTVKFFSGLVEALTSKRIHDTVCGTRAYSRSAAERFLRYGTSFGYGLEIEQVILLLCDGAPVHEVPVDSNVQYKSTAANKLVQNLACVLSYCPGRVSLPLLTELNALIIALMHRRTFCFNSNLVSTDLPTIQFKYEPDGEDGEDAYSLSSA
jgi:hypothetical protein